MAKKKIMTTDQLAVIVKRGFDDVTGRMATKQDLNELRTATRNELHEVYHALSGEIRDVKITLGPLGRMLAAHDVDISRLDRRVERLEKRAGF